MSENILFENIKSGIEIIKNHKPEIVEIPEYIINNIKYELFDWQKEALEYFLYYQNPNSKIVKYPTHLMFNLATGAGKTLLMATTILYYYKQGYKHFLFFVNRKNIVDKTENNFIDNTHSKYLFKDKIVIDNQIISIKQVENFSDNPQSIEIKFTSIQKLYNDIHLQRENRTILDDLIRNDIVMLADEAHHLNTDTSRKKDEQIEIDIIKELTNKSSEKEIERKGWEHTVIDVILKKNGNKQNNKNVLLEFTATIPTNKNVAKKYEDKIIYKFGLKDFLSAGYTKEINLISSNLEKKERILQALLFHWYRHKIALKNCIANFKPVVLFRSKTIEESKNDYQYFLDLINNISINDFKFLKNIQNKLYETNQFSLYETGKSRTERVLQYINNNNITNSEIVEFIKSAFKENNLIITNSGQNKKKEVTNSEQDSLLNSLEDKNNHIRAIFTVERLTEGWDVLNLYDIVRLYQGQNAGGSNKKIPEATTQEKQLIGRGVRYYPFEYQDKNKIKRKFDDDLDNELRIMEELFYYTYDEESRYISHLKEELRKDGYIRDDKAIQTFNLKNEFKNTDFYKTTKIWKNNQIDNPNRIKQSLSDIKKDFFVPYNIKDLEYTEQEIDFDNQDDLNKLNLQSKGLHTICIKFKDIEKHIFRKAVNIKAKQTNSLFKFENLKQELAINSIDDLQNNNFLGDFDIKIIANQNVNYDDIEGIDKLHLTIKFLENIFKELEKSITPKIGSDFETIDLKNVFDVPKVKTINKNNIDENVVKDNSWYVLDYFVGTSEEKDLIQFIKSMVGNLTSNFKEIYLLRNEEVYKIFDFEKGRGFQPDFILFIKDKENNNLYYQIFIEPKGNAYKGFDGTFKSGKEGWKELFLEKISEKYGFNKILKTENKDYRLIGLPFYNSIDNDIFIKKFQELFIQNEKK